jgi:hypothetical protein
MNEMDHMFFALQMFHFLKQIIRNEGYCSSSINQHTKVLAFTPFTLALMKTSASEASLFRERPFNLKGGGVMFFKSKSLVVFFIY